ncbi:MAG: acyl-CoA synthetase, partial [Gammaproteobacteria bacterium]
PINPLLTPAQIADILAAANSRILVTGGPGMSYDVYEKAKAVRDLYPALQTLVVVGEGGAGAVDFSSGIRHQPDNHLISGRTIQEDDPSVCFHTGGTTGAPKLTPQSHRNQLFTAWTCGVFFDVRAGDRMLTGLPLFHANAAITTGLTGFLVGATAILCGELGYRSKDMMGDFWQIVARYRATTFVAVPTIYAALLDQLPDDLDVSSLRVAGCGAAPMPVELLRAFEARTGVRILEGYGMTESGVSTLNPRDGERRIGSVGVRLAYQDVRPVILDSEERYVRDCDVDEVGVLLLKGPNVFSGYVGARDNGNLWPMPGWLNSGDLGRRDADGYIWLAGRAKDLIIRGGHNIDPAVIEEALQHHPAVEIAAAVGRPDAYAGEVPIAYVRLTPGAVVSEAELVEFARQRVPEGPAAPAEVVIVPELPLTAVGKIFKPELRLDAVRRVYARELADLPVSVRTRIDDKLGIVADIHCPAGWRDLARIKGRLERFAPQHFIVHDPDDAA